MPCLQAERLEYFEVLMQACEQRGLTQAAAQFAHAAVSELPSAFAPGDARKIQHASRLWANLLTFALDDNDYEVTSSPPTMQAQASYARCFALNTCLLNLPHLENLNSTLERV